MNAVTNVNRYEGKPLVRLLELYVLWSINRLGDAEGRKLAEMTPKLQSIYAASGTWQQIIASAMKLPADMPDLLRKLWDKNSAIADKSGVELEPQRFAEMVVDENFSNV